MKVKLCSLEEAQKMEQDKVTHCGITPSMHDKFGTIIEINSEANRRLNDFNTFNYNRWWYSPKWLVPIEVEFRIHNG